MGLRHVPVPSNTKAPGKHVRGFAPLVAHAVHAATVASKLTLATGVVGISRTTPVPELNAMYPPWSGHEHVVLEVKQADANVMRPGTGRGGASDMSATSHIALQSTPAISHASQRANESKSQLEYLSVAGGAT